MTADMYHSWRQSPAHRWAVPQLVVFTWLVARPALVVYLAGLIFGMIGAFWVLWWTSLRTARRYTPLEEIADPAALEAIDAVRAQLDPDRRARLVIDPDEPYAACIAAYRPVIVIGPRWLEHPEQLAAVAAHEYGHLLNRHWRTGLWVLVGVPLLWLSTVIAATAATATVPGVGGELLSLTVSAVGLWCTCVAALCTRRRERHHEFVADAVAGTVVGSHVIAEVLHATGLDALSAAGPYSRYPLTQDRISALGRQNREPHSPAQ